MIALLTVLGCYAALYFCLTLHHEKLRTETRNKQRAAAIRAVMQRRKPQGQNESGVRDGRK
jgi:hypothetical protein